MITEEEKQEIIIIKRSSDHDGGHHGGAWKIAFADFMTAMMALFLVLWLINAANEETKKSVASYFNPVKLVDRNRSEKGLDEKSGAPADVADPDEETVEQEKTEETNADEESEAPPTDQELSNQPYEVLDRIVASGDASGDDAGGEDTGLAVLASGGGQEGASGLTYRDPFAPDFWNAEAINRDQLSKTGEEPGVQDTDSSAKTAAIDQTDEMKAEKSDDQAEEMPPETKADELAKKPAEMAEEGDDQAAKKMQATEDAKPAKEQAEMAKGEKDAQPDQAKGEKDVQPMQPDQAKGETDQDPALKQTMKDIEEALTEVFGLENKNASGLTVTTVDEGVMISMTDQLDNSMFEIGSAVPKRDIILAMEKISSVLSKREGNIRIYGHTDSRPFAGGEYGNWQLSSARAQAAYFMLVRGGLAENRISQISGFADRVLKVKANPNASENRRIEILLEVQ